MIVKAANIAGDKPLCVLCKLRCHTAVEFSCCSLADLKGTQKNKKHCTFGMTSLATLLKKCDGGAVN